MDTNHAHERLGVISLLLAQEILELCSVRLAGFVATRVGLIHAKDARGLSVVTLFLVTPASFLTAFEVELTSELARSLALVFAVALVANLMMYALGTLFARLTGASVVERASVTYSNAGNLILPIVLSVLGERYVIYATGYMVVVLTKMVVFPLVMILLFKLSGVAALVADGEKIFMVPMLAVMSCTATTVTQFAQLYGKEPEYASALSVMTTLVSIVTMPLMVQLYLL